MEAVPESILSVFVNLFILQVRPSIALGFSPFFGFQSILGLPRRSFFVITALIACPMLWPTLEGKTFSQIQIVLMVLHEAIIGMVLGFASGIPFWAIESTGQIIDLQRGTTAGSLFNPQLGTVTSPLGNLLLRFFSAYFYATGGFLLFIGVLFASYEFLPLVPQLPVWRSGGEISILELMTLFFRLTMVYVCPFLVAFLLIDFGLGLMNRFVPSLNVFFFSLPVKSMLALILLALCLATLLEVFSRDILVSPMLKDFLKTVFR